MQNLKLHQKLVAIANEILNMETSEAQELVNSLYVDKTPAQVPKAKKTATKIEQVDLEEVDVDV